MADIESSHNDICRLVEKYNSKDFPFKYHELICGENLQKEESILANIHDVLSDMKIEGRMLKFGCGPSVHRIASASRYFHEIICADSSEYNRKEVEKWLENEDRYLDWKPLLDIVAKLEKYEDIESGVEEIKARIRSSVKNVIPCDLLADPPIPEEYGTFDLVLASYGVESIYTSRDVFTNGIKKICDLIKHGGSLMLIGTFNKDLSEAQNELSLSPPDHLLVKTTLEECKMEITSLACVATNNEHTYCHCCGIILLSAKKL